MRNLTVNYILHHKSCFLFQNTSDMKNDAHDMSFKDTKAESHALCF